MLQRFADVTPFRRDPLNFLVERMESTTDPLVPLRIGMRPVYLLTDPDFVKPLLKMPDDVIDKGPMAQKLRSLTGNNFLFATGEQYLRRRPAFQAIVHRSSVGRHVPAIASEVRNAIAGIVAAGTFDARSFSAGLAIRIISLVAFGLNVLSPEDQRTLITSLQQAMADLVAVVFEAYPMPWTRLAERRRIRQTRDDMLQVVRRVRGLAPNSITSRAFEELQLSDREVADEILMLLLAGHDTTGAASTWLLHALATVPGLADRIAAEAADVRDGNGEIDVAKLDSASTTAAAVREILRLYPSAYWFPRGVRQAVEFGGRRLPRGTSIMVSPWAFHRSSHFWEDPHVFRLDRSYTGEAYFPFGTGPRTCVGAALAMLELQIIALETASALQLKIAGAVGAPIPSIHLIPPPMPLNVCRRPAGSTPAVTQASLEGSLVADAAVQPPPGCPFHAPERMTTQSAPGNSRVQ